MGIERIGLLGYRFNCRPVFIVSRPEKSGLFLLLKSQQKDGLWKKQIGESQLTSNPKLFWRF